MVQQLSHGLLGFFHVNSSDIHQCPQCTQCAEQGLSWWSVLWYSDGKAATGVILQRTRRVFYEYDSESDDRRTTHSTSMVVSMAFYTSLPLNETLMMAGCLRLPRSKWHTPKQSTDLLALGIAYHQPTTHLQSLVNHLGIERLRNVTITGVTLGVCATVTHWRRSRTALMYPEQMIVWPIGP